jgi:hypothetical protein
LNFHLDGRVVLRTDPEYKNLYSWMLQEFDANGKQVGRDWVPWDCDLYFTASDLRVNDTIAIEPTHTFGMEPDGGKRVRQRHSISATLHPGDSRRPERRRRCEPSYSMFGTNREISDIGLHIETLGEGETEERCVALGSVSYTADFDFRDETQPDFIVFHLYVRPETFARYIEKLNSGAVDEVVFRSSKVLGFYSDWSPSITTDKIKVLTSGGEHKVEVPNGCEIVPPRLGKVLEAELLHLSKAQFSQATPCEGGD